MTDTKHLPPDDPAADAAQSSIQIDTPNIPPELDPNSPDFVAEEWAEAAAGASDHLKAAVDKSSAAILDSAKSTLAQMGASRLTAAGSAKTLPDTALSAIANSTFSNFMQSMETTNKLIAEFMTGTGYQALQQSINQANAVIEAINLAITPSYKAMQTYFNSDEWKETRQKLADIAANAPVWLEALEEITELTPFLEAELKKPEYQNKSLDDLLEEAETDSDGNPLESSLFVQALTAARAAMIAAASKEKPTRAAIKRAQTVEYPLDKPNSRIWNLLEKDTQGQVTFNMAKYGSRQSILAYYAINFDDLEDDIQITKRLLPFDKRVYIAISALFNAGNNVITLSQIYYAMGYTGRPGTRDITRINDAVTKMTAARIFFDNEQEAEKYKYNRFKYDGSLLPLERGTAIVNGQLADAAIHIFREPPLITFAKKRGQITTVDVKLLQSPVNKTDANLLIDDYLIERISKAKNGKGKSCRVLFKTLYDHTGITSAKQKQRTPEKVRKYLDHYQQQEFITRYTMEKDGITVYWK